MKYLCAALVAVILGISSAEECNNDKVVACYYASWANYRLSSGQFNISNIDPSLCTHLIYTFAGLDINSRIASLDPQLDINWGYYTAFTQLKEKNPCLKTLLAIGGWNEGSRKYSVMASTAESQDAFVESVLRFVVNYNFDGFDFDWEYPANRGGLLEDRENFVQLLRKLKERLAKWDLLLTVAVPMNSEITAVSYDVEEISSIVDLVFLMAYDFTETTSNYTGLIAPMDEVAKTVDIWLDAMQTKNIDPKKLILGIPTYARTFNLKNKDNHGIGAATEGMGIGGEFTLEAGFLSYYELQAELLSDLYNIVKVPEKENYYAYHVVGTEWFTFEAKDTYEAKANYVLDKNLGGMMVWTIDTDDFRGIYNDTYPVLNTIRDVLFKK